MSSVEPQELFAWCDQEPASRYPAVASVLTPFSLSGENGPEWTIVARDLVNKALEPVAVLKRFVDRFSPTSWSGSRVGIMRYNGQLLNAFEEHPDAAVREFVGAEKARFREAINAEIDLEALIFKERDERFE